MATSLTNVAALLSSAGPSLQPAQNELVVVMLEGLHRLKATEQALK
jgi:hypothetical protein